MEKIDDKDKALFKKLYEMIGAIKMSDAATSMLGAAKYTFVMQIKEAKLYKQFGYDWDSFCKEVLKKDRKTVEQELNFLETYGENFMRAIERTGLTKKDLLAFDKGIDAETKASIKKGVLKAGGREFKVAELDDNIEEVQQVLDWMSQKAAAADKMEKVHEKEIRHLEKKERELLHEVNEVKKELAAKEPPSTDEDRKKQFDQQLDLVYKHLAEAGKLMNNDMDFSLCLNDRELAIKYRGAVKSVTALADNLERKIGEV